MPNKKFYSVSKGTTLGIFTLWNKCDASVYRYRHAVYKGFNTIEPAIAFLIADGTFISCDQIPIHDDTSIVKTPKDFGHICQNNCVLDSLDLSILDEYMNENDAKEIHEIPTVVEPQDLHETEVKQSEETTENVPPPKDNVSNEQTKPDNKKLVEKSECTHCKQIKIEGNDDEFMMRCSKCQGWTHFICTQLPTYQLYLLIHTSRKYTCEQCSNTPPEFHSKWSKNKETLIRSEPNEANSDKTLEIVRRIESSVVEAITSQHKSNQDDKICSLQQEIQDINSTNKTLEKLNQKVDTLTKAVSENQNVTEASCTAEQISDILKKDKSTVSNQLKPINDKLSALESMFKPSLFASFSTQMETMNNELLTINKNLEQASKSMEKSVATNSVITQNIEKITTQMHQNLSKSIAPKRVPEVSVDRHPQSPTEFNVETSNRFSPLNNLYDEKETEKQENKATKTLLIGNSHMKPIRTENFIENGIVHKYVEYSYEEMTEKIDELDSDYDCILLQVFTNNIRKDQVQEVVEKTDKFISALQSYCKFAKIILSLPFPTLNDFDLNKKISECNIMFQYKYLNHSLVTICDNAVLTKGNTPERRFFINSPNDKIHLSPDGRNVFIANLKFHIRKVLNIVPKKSINGRGANVRRGNNQNKSHLPPQYFGKLNQKSGQSSMPFPPFYRYPWGPGADNRYQQMGNPYYPPFQSPNSQEK